MNAAPAAYWRSLATGSRITLSGRLLLLLLVPPSLLYALAQRLRAALYRAGIMATRRLPRPVIAIGNITAGGTGKTPVTAWIARFLLERGLRVVVLSRGYGGTLEGHTALVSDGAHLFMTARECGDEPYLLASTVPGLAVVIGADRYRAGCHALESLNPDVFLLDDGFQHLSLHRDMNILLLDCSRPFGNGWTIPAGLLREPRGALGRADLVIHTRCPSGARPDHVSDSPSAACRHELADAVPLAGSEPVPLTALRGRRALAFAGIAEPEGFFTGLRAAGINLVRTVTFADHAPYGSEQLAAIAAARQESGAELVLTTEKDGVKLHGLPDELTGSLYLARLKLAFDDQTPLTDALLNLLQK